MNLPFLMCRLNRMSRQCLMYRMFPLHHFLLMCLMSPRTHSFRGFRRCLTFRYCHLYLKCRLSRWYRSSLMYLMSHENRQHPKYQKYHQHLKFHLFLMCHQILKYPKCHLFRHLKFLMNHWCLSFQTRCRPVLMSRRCHWCRGNQIRLKIHCRLTIPTYHLSHWCLNYRPCLPHHLYWTCLKILTNLKIQNRPR
jgi:hypothetical protein